VGQETNGFELLIANDLDCWQGLFKLTMNWELSSLLFKREKID
jgi:hypothetical protein